MSITFEVEPHAVDSFGDDLSTRQEEEEDNRQLEVLCTSFVLGSGQHQEWHLDVIGNEIILASKWSPFRKITFMLNRWAHLMSCLNDIVAVVKRLHHAGDENKGRRPILGRWILRQSSLVYDVLTLESI